MPRDSSLTQIDKRSSQTPKTPMRLDIAPTVVSPEGFVAQQEEIKNKAVTPELSREDSPAKPPSPLNLPDASRTKDSENIWERAPEVTPARANGAHVIPTTEENDGLKSAPGLGCRTRFLGRNKKKVSKVTSHASVKKYRFDRNRHRLRVIARRHRGRTKVWAVKKALAAGLLVSVPLLLRDRKFPSKESTFLKSASDIIRNSKKMPDAVGVVNEKNNLKVNHAFGGGLVGTNWFDEKLEELISLLHKPGLRGAAEKRHVDSTIHASDMRSTSHSSTPHRLVDNLQDLFFSAWHREKRESTVPSTQEDIETNAPSKKRHVGKRDAKIAKRATHSKNNKHSRAKNINAIANHEELKSEPSKRQSAWKKLGKLVDEAAANMLQ